MVSTKRIDDYLFRHDMAYAFRRSLQPFEVRLLTEKAIVVLTMRAVGFAPWQIAKKTGIPVEQVEQGLQEAKTVYTLTPPVLRAFARYADDLEGIELEIQRYLQGAPARREAVLA